MRKKILLSLLCTLLIITQVSCKTNEPISDTEFMLDTFCTIEIHGMDEDKATEIISEAFDECKRYEGLFSRTMEGTDIYKINHAEGQPVEVSDETAELIRTSLELCQETDGLFDISIGQITNLWNFKDTENPTLPDDSDIQTYLPSVDYNNINIEGNTVTLSDPNTWLDLGSIAKGYIADKLSAFMVDKGVTSGIVNLGGNIVAIGEKEDGNSWNIGLETPFSDSTEILGAVEMKDQTVVTSGTYERHFNIDGKEYHHVLDPATGYPKDTDILSVSIKSDMGNSTLCDGYSTTCLLLGKDKAIEFMADKKGYEYCITDMDGNITQSDGFGLVEEAGDK